MRFRLSAGLKSRVQRLGKPLAIIFSLWFCGAVVCLFFIKRYPGLQPFVFGTFKLYFGVLIAFMIALNIVGPGVYVAKELFELVEEPRCSRMELYLTWFWAGFAGFLLTSLLGVAAWLLVFGPLVYVRLWFIGVCWLVLLIPWLLIGSQGRRILRRVVPTQDSGKLKSVI